MDERLTLMQKESLIRIPKRSPEQCQARASTGQNERSAVCLQFLYYIYDLSEAAQHDVYIGERCWMLLVWRGARRWLCD